MRRAVRVVVSGFLACVSSLAQPPHQVEVCDWTSCQFIDSSVMGGLRWEDYKVSNPAATQFDPAQRLKQLNALGAANTDIICQAPAAFGTPAPTITFQASGVQARIFYMTPAASFSPSEFMDVRFTNFTASNGYSSPSFGFRMARQLALDGTESPQYVMTVQAGNFGLENISGLFANGTGFAVDPVGQTAIFTGTLPSSQLLTDAILGVLANAQSILKDAQFTVTNPAPSGKTLWTASEITSLAGQAQPWILAATSTNVPLGPPFTCLTTQENGRGTCNGQDQITAFINTMMTWGGEYLGLRTQKSFSILVSNLRTWATANAPSVDAAWEAMNPSSFFQAKVDLALPILMVWPTLRADPNLAASDQQLIENWIENWLVPSPPTGFPNGDYYPNDLGYWDDAVMMADAIRRSDNTTFAFGVQRFYGALYQMRDDGSFPFAAALSACSADYSNTDLIHLVSIAEMAATQGYDLYSMSVNGKSLETAIEFLLDAYQKPSLLAQYSKAALGGCFKGNPGDPPDFSVFSSPSGALAWMEPYIARFPFSTTAARLRAILGSNISAPPFPLMVDRAGLNTTCAFRTSYEIQPVNGTKVTVVSGSAQTVAANQPAPAPVKVQVTDNTGKPLANTLVSFAVTQGSANVAGPAQLLTDANGMASANVTMGSASGPATVTAKALGVGASFAFTVPGPEAFNGGVIGVGASVPAVTAISPGALFSIYGANFVLDHSGDAISSGQLVNGALPTNLFGVCVTVGGKNAPLLDVFPGLINAMAPNNIIINGLPVNAVAPYTGIVGSTEVIVITGCGTATASQSMPQMVAVQTAAPEFLYFANNTNGQNPVAAVNAVTGSYVGPTSLGTTFAPAHPGDVVSIYASGFGPTNPAITPGTFAAGAASTTNPVTVTLGSVTLDSSAVLYAGTAPGELISQLNIRIPAGTPAGNLPLRIQLAGVSSPPGAFLAIASPSN